MFQDLTRRGFDRSDRIGEAQPLKRLHPLRLDPDGHEGRAGFDDGMPQAPRDGIAVARGSTARIGPAADSQNDSPRGQSRIGRGHHESRCRAGRGIHALDRERGAPAAEDRPASAQPVDQGFEHVDCPIRDRKDLAVSLDLGGDAFGFEQPHRLINVELPQGRAEERPGWSKRILDGTIAPAPRGIESRIDGARNGLEPAQAARVRDVASSAPRHENLHAGPAVLLEHDHARSQLGRPDARQETRGPRSQDGDVAGWFFSR